MNLSPWQIRADGTVLATFASAVETSDNLDDLPERRFEPMRIANRHGIWIPEDGGFFDYRTIPLLIWVSGTDVDGQITHPNGAMGHLRKNLDDLQAILGKRGYITLQRDIASRTNGSPLTLTLEAQALVVSRITSRDRNGVARALAVECLLPWPFWHELPQISRPAATSHSFTTAGTLPVANQVLVFSGDGTLTDNHGASIPILGSSGAVTVDVRKGEVYQGGVLAMHLLNPAPALEHWMEWPARTAVTLTSTVNVAVTYYHAR